METNLRQLRMKILESREEFETLVKDIEGAMKGGITFQEALKQETEKVPAILLVDLLYGLVSDSGVIERQVIGILQEAIRKRLRQE